MHYPDSRWRPRCQGKSRDDVSGRICQLKLKLLKNNYKNLVRLCRLCVGLVVDYCLG